MQANIPNTVVEVSFILCVYDGEKFLNQTIQSLLNQEKVSFEIIAINDGSTDNSLSLLNSWSKKDNRIHVYSQKNLGLSIARNFGISKAKGAYIASASQDDIYFSNKTLLQKYFLNKNKLDFCFTNVSIIDQNNKVKPNAKSLIYNKPFWNPFKLLDVILHMKICSPTFLCKKTCYEKLIWNPAIIIFADYQLWIKMFLFFKGNKIKRILFQKRFNKKENFYKYMNKYGRPFHFLEHRASIWGALMMKLSILRFLPSIIPSIEVGKLFYYIESNPNDKKYFKYLIAYYKKKGIPKPQNGYKLF